MYRKNIPKSECPHITTVGDYTKEDIIEKQQSTCDSCDNAGPNLWVCLHRDCLHVGCHESASNHSIRHFQRHIEHCLMLNLTSLQVYCLLCKCEVFLENNDPPLPGMLTSQPAVAKSDTDSDDELESPEENIKPKGLTGLQNMGNTCYMNSALQSLSNCPQLTNFFLECGAFVKSDKKPGLSKSYMLLVKEMWHRKRPSYVVPSGIAFGIKLVFPVFRGYTQQDAQEFLRCFMDQLHEELKEPIVELPGISSLSPTSQEEFVGTHPDSGITLSEESSQSDADYETCESGANSEKDSCADEAVDPSDPSQESSDVMIPPFNSSLSFKQNSQSSYLRESNFETISSGVDVTSNFDVADTVLGYEKQKRCSIPPECCSYTSDSAIANDVSLSCDRSDVPLLKEDCKSSFETSLSGDSKIGALCMNEKHCNPSTIMTSKHISCNKGACSLQQTSQIKHVASRAIINSMLINRKKKPVQYRSIISDIFDGKILSSVQCLTCDTVSFTKETFQDLSLPIPNRDHLHMIHASQGSHQKSGGTCTDVYSHKGWFSTLFSWMISWFWGPSISLQDCLAAFFSADELKGDNMYSCEKCKKLRNGIKYSKVIELPEVLCIHLKRFRHEVMYSSKISSHVSFPLEGLDMSPFIHKSYPCGVTTYDLSSVICHHGTAGSGHYTAYSLNYLTDQWYEFDDQYVTAVDAEVVRNCEAYVLFYRKSGEEMIKKRQCAVELLDRSKNEHGLLKFHISKQWINKFNNFAEPGPITNTDFLCIHGGVPPQKASYASELCTVLPQAVWEYLHDTFGGGPPCTYLYICPVCQAELDRLNQKRKTELDDFMTMNADFRRMENPSVVYALSMSWFKTWETFVCRDGEIPGPIDNSAICYLKNSQPVLKLGSDYCSVSKEMYQYLLDIYGGGPDIALQPNSVPYSGPQFSASGSSSISLTKNAVPLSSYSYVQNVQVHSSPRTTSSSHNQPVCSATCIPCDNDIHKSKTDESLIMEEKIDFRVEEV